MLQRQNTKWTPGLKPADAFADVSQQTQVLPIALTASASSAPVLTESMVAATAVSPETSAFTAMTLSPDARAESSTSYADIAVTALAFIGLWLIVVGFALLARRLRLVRNSNTISEAAWQRQLRTAARQTPV